MRLLPKRASCDELAENSAQQSRQNRLRSTRFSRILIRISSVVNAITKGMPASLVKRFTILREQRRGQALAIARDGYCLGCNMHLPPQFYNNLYQVRRAAHLPALPADSDPQAAAAVNQHPVMVWQMPPMGVLPDRRFG